MGKKNNKWKQANASPAPAQGAPVVTAPVAQKPEPPAAMPPAPEVPKAESLIASAVGLFGKVMRGGATEPVVASDTSPLEARLEDALAKALASFEECQKREQQAQAAEQASKAEQVRLWGKEQQLNTRETGIEQREQAVFQREQLVEQQKQSVSEEKQRLSDRESALKHDEDALLREQEELKKRELNAEAGFAQQRRHSLELLEQEAKALHQQLSEQRERLSSERAAWEKERAEAREKLAEELRKQRADHEAALQKEASAQGERLRQERTARENELSRERTAHDEKLRKERAEHEEKLRQERTEHEEKLRQERTDQEVLAHEERSKLRDERAQLEKEKREQAAEKRKLQYERDDLEEMRENLEQRAQKLAAGREEALRFECSALEDRLKEAQRERERLSGILVQREEMDRRFGHQPPEEVLKELLALREQRAELEKQLAARPSADAAERLRALAALKDDLEQENTRLYQENQSLKHDLARHRTAVVEIETIRDQKAALESSRDLLHATIEDLRKDVDDRIRRSDGKSPFPALTEMDLNPDLQSTLTLREEPLKLNEFVLELQHRIAQDAEARKAGKMLVYPPEVIRSFLGGLAMSPLLLLQGISGTGKTTLPLVFARAIGAGNQVIEVQAGWRDKNDLIGHFNAFERRFYEEPFLQALYKARCPRFRGVPFLIVLDEMNLSHPEQYFAELLSAMEREVGSQKLHLMTAPVEPSPEGLEEKGQLLALPRNVWFVGTANHDETTKDFADKTYDRAHVMEFHGSHPQGFKPRPCEPAPPLSLQSLRKAFEQAQVDHAAQAQKAQAFLREQLAQPLKEHFRIGMSNRLDRQLKAYVPVVIAAGGTLAEAVDHILATKLLRKLRNQHDARGEDLLGLQQRLMAEWPKRMGEQPPRLSLEAIKDQLKRLGTHEAEEAA